MREGLLNAAGGPGGGGDVVIPPKGPKGSPDRGCVGV